MNKEKTAMQMLIEEIDVCISNLGRKNDLLTRHQKGRLVDAKSIAKSLIQKEQEQIEKAFSEGYQEAVREECGHESRYKDTNGVDYYKYKYGGEDVDR